MRTLETQIEQYAAMAIQVGGEPPARADAFSSGARRELPIERADFVRLLATKAYDAGASRVHVLWEDEGLHPPHPGARVGGGPCARFQRHSRAGLRKAAADGAAFLRVSARDPDLLDGVETRRVTESQRAMMTAMAPLHGIHRGDARQLVHRSARPRGPGPTRCSPDRRGRARGRALARPLAGRAHPWGRSGGELARASGPALRANGCAQPAAPAPAALPGNPGTDLVIELPERHQWLSCAGSRNAQGVCFVPNMPTEEVFTVPARNGVHGTVRSTMPLNYNGVLIQGPLSPVREWPDRRLLRQHRPWTR